MKKQILCYISYKKQGELQELVKKAFRAYRTSYRSGPGFTSTFGFRPNLNNGNYQGNLSVRFFSMFYPVDIDNLDFIIYTI